MPTRERYLNDPEYARAFECAFETIPDKPFFEIYLPKELLTRQLTNLLCDRSGK